jgi:hypothetical protein
MKGSLDLFQLALGPVEQIDHSAREPLKRAAGLHPLSLRSPQA